MDPDTLAAACSILAREWGSYGYAVRGITTGYRDGALHVTAADGSRFILAVDRYACHSVDADDDPTAPTGTGRSGARAAAAILRVRELHNEPNGPRACHFTGAERPAPAPMYEYAPEPSAT